jgi:hypothetical protein
MRRVGRAGPGDTAQSRTAARLCAAALLLAGACAAELLPSVAAAETPLPPGVLRDSGLEAWNAGHPLDAYVRLRQYLERAPQAPDREAVEQRVALAREALVRAAPRQSLILAAIEQHGDVEHPPHLAVARLAATDGRVTVESMRGPGPREAQWQRAGVAEPDAFAAFIGRLLDAPAFRVHLPQQAFHPNLPGPRRAATLRIVIGDETWEGQGLRGEPYEKLAEAAARALDFAGSTPLGPSPPRPGDGGGSRP